MNFRGILSKTSLRSSSSGKSNKDIKHSEEITKLESEIETLKLTVDSLKVSLESRDAAIGTIAREKEKIYVELKSAQRTNRNLHQQLEDERDIHSKEKEFLINEITRLSKRNEQEMKLQQHEDGQEDQHEKLLGDLKAKDEVIYNIGSKYMKIKSSKTTLQKKYDSLLIQNKKMCENIIVILQENRQVLDDLLDDLQDSTISPDSKMYLNLLQMNAKLHYENTQLKIYLSAKSCSEIGDQDTNAGLEQSNTICSIGKQCKSKSKSDVKLKVSSTKTPDCGCHTIHSKSKSQSKHDCLEQKKFQQIHRKFAPNFRGTHFRSTSDSCIVRRNARELKNIK